MDSKTEIQKPKLWTVAYEFLNVPLIHEWVFLKETNSSYIVGYEGRRHVLRKKDKKGFLFKKEAVDFREKLINARISKLMSEMEKLQKQLDNKHCTVIMEEERWVPPADFKL